MVSIAEVFFSREPGDLFGLDGYTSSHSPELSGVCSNHIFKTRFHDYGMLRTAEFHQLHCFLWLSSSR